MHCFSITSLNPSFQRVVWGERFGSDRMSYITANASSELGLIAFKEDGSEGEYTPIETYPGSGPPSTPSRMSVFLPAAPAPAPNSDQSPALSPAGLHPQLSSPPMPNTPAVPYHNGLPNHGVYPWPFWCPFGHPHPGFCPCLPDALPLPEAMMPQNPILGHQTISPHGSSMGDASPGTNSWGDSPVFSPLQFHSTYGSASPGTLSTSSARSPNIYMPPQMTYVEPPPQPGPSIRHQGGLLLRDDQIAYPRT